MERKIKIEKYSSSNIYRDNIELKLINNFLN